MPYSPIYAPFLASDLFAPLLIIALVWTLVLKGFALWYAARSHQKAWFIALLILNTLGILEIVYLIWFRPRDHSSASMPSSSSTQ
ncbi:MAG: DUF5652 family protein [Minisyncoccia bacterium]